MPKFLSYLRNEEGGAVEYLLVIAGIGGAVAVATTSSTVKNAINSMYSNVFTGAGAKATFVK
jgi:Flp pilus assembly pilin Flp